MPDWGERVGDEAAVDHSDYQLHSFFAATGLRNSGRSMTRSPSSIFTVQLPASQDHVSHVAVFPFRCLPPFKLWMSTTVPGLMQG